MTKKFKCFLIICAVLALLMQGAGLYFLISMRSEISLMHTRLFEIRGELSALPAYPEKRELIAYRDWQWLSIHPETKQAECVIRIMPYTYVPGMQGALCQHGNIFGEMDWDGKERVYTTQVSLALADALEDEGFYFLQERDGSSWIQWLEGGAGSFERGYYVFQTQDTFENTGPLPDNKTIRLHESFTMEERWLPFSGKFKSGRLFIVGTDTQEELYSIALNENGAAEIKETVSSTYIELRAEVLCEDGMVYRYGICAMGWNQRYEGGETDWSGPYDIDDLVAVFPDGTQLRLPTEANQWG